MKRLKNTFIAPTVWLSAVVLFLAIAPLEAFGLTFTTIDVPGAIRTLAIGINRCGDIVGWFQDPKGIIHGFLLSGGSFTTIDAPGTTHTVALGINARGQIVGHHVAGEKFQSFLLGDGNFTIIDVPGALATKIRGLNSRGQIVGVYTDARFADHGFLLEDENFTTIDDLPGAARFIDAGGINARGQIVGQQFDEGIRGFLLDKGNFTTIDVPGAAGTTVLGINADGQIVGMYVAQGTGAEHGFVAE